MSHATRELTRLAHTPSSAPVFQLDLEEVVRRARTRRIRRLAGVALVIVIVSAGIVLPLRLLSEFGGSNAVSPGDGRSISPILVPDHGFLKSKPYDGAPYVDHELPEDNYLVTEKVVIGYGQVREIPWSMAAYLTRARGIRNNGISDPPVACADFFYGASYFEDRSAGPGGGFPACASSGASRNGIPVPEDPQRKMYLTGPAFSYELPAELPDIVVFAGAVSKDVASVEVITADRRKGEAMILKAPPELGWNFFVVFPPPFIDATFVARDAAGRVLERRQLDGCAGAPFVNASVPHGCRNTRYEEPGAGASLQVSG